jgi:CspA family cold shock protein
MKEGTVKFFDKSKGFGFITQKEGGDIFVHLSGCSEEIYQQDVVLYDIKQGKKGLNAVNVRVI